MTNKNIYVESLAKSLNNKRKSKDELRAEAITKAKIAEATIFNKKASVATKLKEQIAKEHIKQNTKIRHAYIDNIMLVFGLSIIGALLYKI